MNATSHARPSRRRALAGVLALGTGLALTACSTPAGGESGEAEADYPTQPITIVVPYAAGGGTDVVANIVSQALAEDDITVRLVNMPGAGASEGAGYVLGEDPDGYTLGFSDLAPAITTPLSEDVGYEPGDLNHLGRFTTYGYAFVASQDSGVTLDSLVESAESGEEVTYGTSGPLTGATLAVELLADMSDVEFTFVPYDGSGEILLAVQAGEVDFGIISASAALSALDGGQPIDVLGTTLGERDAATSDLQTVSEATGLDYAWPGFRGLFGQKDLPDNVMQFWTDFFADADLTDALETAGETWSPLGPEEMAAFVEETTEITQPLIDGAMQ